MCPPRAPACPINSYRASGAPNTSDSFLLPSYIGGPCTGSLNSPFPKLPHFHRVYCPRCRTEALPRQRVTPPRISVSLPKEEFYLPPSLKNLHHHHSKSLSSTMGPQIALPMDFAGKNFIF